MKKRLTETVQYEFQLSQIDHDICLHDQIQILSHGTHHKRARAASLHSKTRVLYPRDLGRLCCKPENANKILNGSWP